jgi:RNA methyltransferase, TrmH family
LSTLSNFYCVARPIMNITESELITSKSNTRLKLARSVRDGREPGLIFVEGVRLVGELLNSPVDVETVFVSELFAASPDGSELIGKLKKSSQAEINLVAAGAFDSIVDTHNTQGIVVIAGAPSQSNFDDFSASDGLFVFLNRANNPSNLGALIRSAEAAGVSGVIVSPGSADPFSPKAVRASMGSIFRVPVYTNVSLEAAVSWARSKSIRTVAADISAVRSYTEVDWSKPHLVVFGSEARGLEKEELEKLDDKILIPMENGVESLNLAVSAGIILFEAKRQRSSG